MSNHITTYTGKYFEPANPDPDMICIEDIAHALSLVCRANGHVKSFWSVGQHCICCAKEAQARGLSNRLILACLLHDATECFMSDVPSPYKHELPEFRKHEKILLDIVYKKYLGSTLSQEEEKQLKEIDDTMLWYDLHYLLRDDQERKAPPIHIQLDYTVRLFQDVEEEYLSLYRQYAIHSY